MGKSVLSALSFNAAWWFWNPCPCPECVLHEPEDFHSMCHAGRQCADEGRTGLRGKGRVPSLTQEGTELRGEGCVPSLAQGGQGWGERDVYQARHREDRRLTKLERMRRLHLCKKLPISSLYFFSFFLLMKNVMLLNWLKLKCIISHFINILCLLPFIV